MGNNLGKKRQTIEEKYTRPQGLYENPDIDIKMVRKLVLKSKLAPCYPGEEEGSNDREECPICFLYYPSLNRSKCCSKGICTECYVQMKPSRRACPTRCPFCKENDYSAEYMGVRSKEERHLEQIEEQKVIEARIRMQQEERLDEERLRRERMERGEIPGCSNSELVDETFSRIILQPSQDRARDSNADLEDLMLEEAIWASIHDNGHRAGPNPISGPSSSAWRRRPGEDDDFMVTPVGETGHLALGGVEDSFEEQMMMALAISLAESRSRRAESDAMAR